MGKSPPPSSVMMLGFFMGIASLPIAKTDILEALGAGHQSAVLVIPKLRVRRTDPTSRSRDRLSKYMAGDGNRLSDLVAAISELRHSATFAAPGAIVVLSNVRMGRKHTS